MAKYFFYDTDIIKLLLRDDMASGGAAVQSYAWFNGLTSIGNEACIATYENQVKGPLKPGLDSVELVSLYDRRRGLRWIRWISYRFPSIYRALKDIQPDYLYQSIPYWESFFISIICKWLKIKYIIRLSNDNQLDERYLERHSKFEYILLKLGIQLSDYVLCQNDYQFGLVKKMFPNKRMLKIHNPYVFPEQQKGNGRIRGYIAWVGNFRFQKNLKLLYEIAVLLKNEKFEIAGVQIKTDSETDEYLPKLRSLENVTFRGHINRNDILDFLSNAKYILNTSYYEGFSNTFLESMSVGTPVLTTPNANPDKIISKNKVGIVYEHAEDLKSKLLQLTENEYQELSDRAIEYVRNNHDHIQLAKVLVKFLEGKNTSPEDVKENRIVNA